MGEIRLGKLAVVFLRVLVISLGGGDFVSEVAEVVDFVVEPYSGGPFSTSFAPVDAFIS